MDGRKSSEITDVNCEAYIIGQLSNNFANDAYAK